MAEKLDPLSDLDVTKLRPVYPIGCSFKKKKSEDLVRRDVLNVVFGAATATYGGRTRARTWDPLIKSQLLFILEAQSAVSSRPHRCWRSPASPPDVNHS